MPDHGPAHRSSHKGERKSRRQVGFLMSSGSPLTDEQKRKLRGELRSGAVRVGFRGGRR